MEFVVGKRKRDRILTSVECFLGTLLQINLIQLIKGTTEYYIMTRNYISHLHNFRLNASWIEDVQRITFKEVNLQKIAHSLADLIYILVVC